MRQGTPEIKLEASDIIVYLSISHPHNCTYVDDLGLVTMETQLAAMEKLAHAHAICTKSFILINSKDLAWV